MQGSWEEVGHGTQGNRSSCAVETGGRRKGGREGGREGREKVKRIAKRVLSSSPRWSTVSHQLLRDSVSFSVLRRGITSTISNSSRGQSLLTRLDRKKQQNNYWG